MATVAFGARLPADRLALRALLGDNYQALVDGEQENAPLIVVWTAAGPLLLLVTSVISVTRSEPLARVTLATDAADAFNAADASAMAAAVAAATALPPLEWEWLLFLQSEACSDDD